MAVAKPGGGKWAVLTFLLVLNPADYWLQTCAPPLRAKLVWTGGEWEAVLFASSPVVGTWPLLGISRAYINLL